MKKTMENLYKDRPLSEGYPGLKRLGVDYFQRTLESPGRDEVVRKNTAILVGCLKNLINLATGTRTVLVIGCGPRPLAMKLLLDDQYDPVGVDVLPEYVNAAREFLRDGTRVHLAKAESLPFDANSKRIIIMESLLEHVDSPLSCLSEAHRVLEPGGVLYVSTTNRFYYTQMEYRVRFYNWLPALVKECYVLHHLHYQPTLANYTPLPAVHWFSYSKLCELGRLVGFGQFYSRLDLVGEESPWVEKSPLRKWLQKNCRYNTWLRALALTQLGGYIFMLKRATENINAPA